MLRVRICQRALCLVLTVLLLCSLTGCMLLPKEEEERTVSFVRSDEIQEYNFISPERADLEKTVDISCSYTQMEEEALRFALDNQLVESVFVSKGDIVKKGTLLAKLQSQDLEVEIEELQNAIIQEQKEIDQLKIKKDNDKNYVELDYKYKNISKAERNKMISEIEEAAEGEIKAKEDDVYIKKLRLAEKQKMDTGSKIYAPFDGFVSYIKEELKGSVSDKDAGVIRMIDPKKCLFTIYKTEDTSILKEGQSYKVDCDGLMYEGTIVPVKDADDSYLYLQLKTTAVNLEVGAIGIIRCQIESKKNVLVVPSNVIHKGNDHYFVYMEDKNKIKVIRNVEIGMITEELTEIVSGLSEDDLIINE